MKLELSQTAVALSVGLPAAVLIAAICAKKVAEAFPNGAYSLGAKPMLWTRFFGWVVHFGSGFLICALLLAAVTNRTSGRLVVGAIVGFVAAAIALFALPPVAESARSAEETNPRRVKLISFGWHLAFGVLLGAFYAATATKSGF